MSQSRWGSPCNRVPRRPSHNLLASSYSFIVSLSCVHLPRLEQVVWRTLDCCFIWMMCHGNNDLVQIRRYEGNAAKLLFPCYSNLYIALSVQADHNYYHIGEGAYGSLASTEYQWWISRGIKIRRQSCAILAPTTFFGKKWSLVFRGCGYTADS